MVLSGVALFGSGLLMAAPAAATVATASFRGFVWNTAQVPPPLFDLSAAKPTPSLPEEGPNGIAPATPGEVNQTTKMLNDDSLGLKGPLAPLYSNPGSFLPGAKVSFVITYPLQGSDVSRSFEISDSIVQFLPTNPNISAIEGMIHAHGQLLPTPGDRPAVIGYDATTDPELKGAVDSVEWQFPDDQQLPGQFAFSWTIPANAEAGTIFCNYAKTTGGGSAGAGDDRKAGACFTVGSEGSEETTTSTSTTSTPPPIIIVTPTPVVSTTTVAPTTVAPTTVAPTTSTTSGQAVLPAVESTTTTVAPTTSTVAPTTTTVPAATLPVTGSNTRQLALLGGIALMLGGLALVGAGRRSGAMRT